MRLAVLPEVGENLEDRLGRNRECLVSKEVAARIESHDEAVCVDERPARVAGRDRRVCLVPERVVAAVLEEAVVARDDAHRDRPREPPRRAHREHDLADLKTARRKHRDGDVRPIGQIELQKRDVEVLVLAEHLCRKRASICELAAYFARFVDDMVVGQHLAVLRDYYARSRRDTLAVAAGLGVVVDYADEDYGRRDGGLRLGYYLPEVGRWRYAARRAQHKSRRHGSRDLVHFSVVLSQWIFPLDGWLFAFGSSNLRNVANFSASAGISSPVVSGMSFMSGATS